LAAVIQIPLSQISSQDDFTAEVKAYRAALERHNRGKPGIAAPTAHPLVQSVIARVPQTGPVAKRGPDDFIVQSYEFIDDRPVSPEIQALRDSILN
jgi:hypothetical protein